ncbi:cobalamin biosynthesis protein [Ruminococcus flavefaciens]|uniref:cobalamin biosynthesis protein n=1 Tax=Ruminococcus flavefaciens TaxID=1265 RepID=UPI0004917DA2|nr:cobalamin biosynthesis protein [Ruminococcus flavefaciens]
MNIAVFSVTENGRQLSVRIAEALGAEHRVSRYCFHKHTDDNAAVFWNMGSMVGRLFERSDVFIFVCACGIAVRAAAPYLGTKPDDPAIIVMDDGGRFVIPVLSGHIGSANHIAEILADSLGSTAVITTSEDEAGGFSLESFVAANDLIICDGKAAKEISSAVLHDEKIGFFSNYKHSGLPEELTEFGVCRTGICIDANTAVKPFDVTVNLVPKNVVLGMRCKSDTSAEAVESAVTSALDGIGIKRISCIAAVGEVPELCSFCEKLGVSFKIYGSAELDGGEAECEQIALKSGGKLIIKEKEFDGISIAVSETPVFLDFERKS